MSKPVGDIRILYSIYEIFIGSRRVFCQDTGNEVIGLDFDKLRDDFNRTEDLLFQIRNGEI